MPNPALEQLGFLVGEWDMEISGARFLPDPQTRVHGPSRFEWVEGGAFLALRQGGGGAPQATWLIGRDGVTGPYKVFYFDSRGVSRVYEMTFKDSVWKMWRESPGFSQRFRGVLNKKRDVIVAEWEKSKDGREWEHDFDIKYTKASGAGGPGEG